MSTATAVLPAPIEAPAPTVETIAITERGEKLLALIRCREALPGGWPWLAAELDRRIANLLTEG
jgi:hypothetical protein